MRPSSSAQTNLAALFAVVTWFAVLAQLYLIIQNRTASVSETIVRFFSYFTILTNTLAAVYFSRQTLSTGRQIKAGRLTALTVYITVVGLVYQFVLRQVWHPTGLQKLVDELLHSVNPLLVIFYWYRFEVKGLVRTNQIFSWLVYPFLYLVFILVRGHLSGFYPYPFIHVANIGLGKALTNSFKVLLVFVVLSYLFILLGKRLANAQKSVRA